MQDTTEETTSGDIISAMEDYALVTDHPPSRFVGIDDLMEKFNMQDQSQYLTFGQVNADDYHSIYKYRDECRQKFLLTYLSPIETLIVKIPSYPTELPHRTFGALLFKSVLNMGLKRSEFHGTGSQSYKSNYNSSSQFFSEKEGDSMHRNRALRPNDYTDWPHFVIEADESEALPRLQADSRWWIENSKGQVRMVLLLNVDTKKRTIRILKYISVPPFSSTSHINNPLTAMPSLTTDI